MNISIIGVGGLIGGSLAKKLHNLGNFRGEPLTVTAYNRTASKLETALKDGVVDIAAYDPKTALRNADLIILCLYPEANIRFIEDNAEYIKSGAVITDVTGIKTEITKRISAVLPDNIEFIGSHPMAGKEKTGYENSTAELFEATSYIITPTEQNKPETIDLIRALAESLGCGRVTVTTPREHDKMIAYTSQLTHVVAVALCDNPIAENAKGFGGGSLRDATRVADINASMWSELFISNKDELCKRIIELEDKLKNIRSLIENENRSELEDIMNRAANNKRSFLK